MRRLTRTRSAKGYGWPSEGGIEMEMVLSTGMSLRLYCKKIDPGNWSDYRANMLLDAVDFNGDGLIQHEEFVTWLGLDHDRWVTARRSLADEAKIAS
mmetsp:Transcript_32117/g.58508  ORF Transcript_32117/g.58508 Transcript_32117/m.58508 type:complete len:97 (+) Transcript_32117:695-985(+)